MPIDHDAGRRTTATEGPAARRTPRVSLPMALAWLATLAMAASSAAVVWTQREEARDHVESALKNSAVLLAEQTASVFDQADALLRSVASRYAAIAGGRPSELARLTDEARAEAATNPFVRRIGIVDADGDAVLNTEAPSGRRPPLSARDRAYFRRAAGGERGLIFDGPLHPKLVPDWSLMLARRVEDADGRFIGVAVAIIPVRGFEDYLAKADVGRSGVVNLRTADFRQVARVPGVRRPEGQTGNVTVPESVVRSIAGRPELRQHLFRQVSPIDGVDRLYVYQRFRDYPFWLVAGRGASDAQGTWQATAALLALIVVPVSGLMFAAARRLDRQQQRLERGIAQRTRELAHSERFFRGLADTLPSMIGYWDAALVNRFANAAHRAWFGRGPEDLRGRPLAELLGPDAFAEQAPHFREALKGRTLTFEARLARPDGALGDLLVTLTPHEADGVVHGVFALATDITARKRAESRMRRQADELDDLYNGAPCGYHTLDADGVYLRVNDTELRWLGRERDEVLGQPVTRFLTPASAELFHRHVAPAVECPARMQFEAEFVRRDGSVMPVLVSALIERDAGGRVLGARSALIDDSRRRQEQATLRRVLAASPMAVRIAGLGDNRVLFQNRAFCELVRRPEAQALGMDVSANYVDPQAFREIREQLEQGGSVVNRLVQLHLPDRPEAPSVWALASYMGIEYDARPAVLAWLFDVTDLHEARRSAEAANRAKSTFLANMSHEIRTPLNAIMGMTALALPAERDPAQAGRLRRIDAASRHLLQVINDVLDLSKIESGRMRLERRALSVAEVVHHAADLVRLEATAKGLALQVQTADLPGGLLGDETRLKQTLLNLLGNAVKFTDRGWVRLTATTTAVDASSVQVRFDVEDTGIGIEPAVQSRLFEAFEQGDASTTRMHGGTGLGLALTRRFAALMGGDCGVDSRPGQGSRFWISARFEREAGAPAGPRLDAAAGAAAADAAAAEPARRTVADAPAPERSAAELRLDLRRRHGGAAVLVAEDDEVARDVACALLQAAGLRVALACDGRQAVELAAAQRFAAILMDMQMPVMDGLEATRRIRAAETSPAVIVAMTANAFDEDRAACLAAGMDDHLAKPVQTRTLLATLLHWLDARSPAGAAPAGVAVDGG